MGNFSEFTEELEDSPAQTVGELFIFVGECHRTQSGEIPKTMKAIKKMPYLSISPVRPD
ncbi:hypothetical protein ACFLUR_03070 [Chloroflexota bacterium]